jgi:hypothetical protein
LALLTNTSLDLQRCCSRGNIREAPPLGDYSMIPRIKHLLVIGLTCSLLAVAQENRATAPHTPDNHEAEVDRIVRERLKASAIGDVTTWESHISAECIWTGPALGLQNTEDAARETAAASALPARPPDEIRQFLVKIFGDAAIATYVSVQRGPDGIITKQFRKTDTYIRRKNDWQLICAAESFVPPRQIIKVEFQTYDQYSGVYELDSKISVKIWRENLTLLMQWSDEKEPSELFPCGQDTFFDESQLGDWFFSRGQDGKVSGLIYRMGGSEVVHRKTK